MPRFSANGTKALTLGKAIAARDPPYRHREGEAPAEPKLLLATFEMLTRGRGAEEDVRTSTAEVEGRAVESRTFTMPGPGPTAHVLGGRSAECLDARTQLITGCPWARVGLPCIGRRKSGFGGSLTLPG